jgi:hypothetical protein
MKLIIRRLTDDGRTIDMTPDGQFRAPPPTPWATKLLRWAIVIAIGAAALSLAGFVLWFALMLIPIAIGAALIAYGAFRWRMWKAKQARTGTNLYRP